MIGGNWSIQHPTIQYNSKTYNAHTVDLSQSNLRRNRTDKALLKTSCMIQRVKLKISLRREPPTSMKRVICIDITTHERRSLQCVLAKPSPPTDQRRHFVLNI